MNRNLVGSIYGKSSVTIAHFARSINKHGHHRHNSHREPSIDTSYHVSVHLAKLFQSRRFLEIDQSETRITCV
jgi:hypothetical protein